MRTFINIDLFLFIRTYPQSFVLVLLNFYKFPIMQLSSIQLKLAWLLLPTVATAASVASGGLTSIGTGQLNLLTPQNLSTSSVGRISYCKHDDDPYTFTSSLNYTFPRTPSISESFLSSAGLTLNDDTYPFDCFLEIPGGIVVFEVCYMPHSSGKETRITGPIRACNIPLMYILQIKGDIDSDGTLAFQVWLSVLIFNYEIGVYSCNLLDLEKDPCAFDIHKRFFDGQGGLYPKQDPDPDYIDLCLEVHGTVKVPYSRVSKKVDFEKCFYRFPKQNTVGSDS